MKLGRKPQLRPVKESNPPLTRDFGHEQRRKAKEQKLEFLNVLIKMREATLADNDSELRSLKLRYRQTQRQLAVMRP